VKIASAFGREVFTQRDLFDVLLRARAANARFWFNSETGGGRYTRQQNAPAPEAGLPRESDETLDGYGARVREAFGGRFCLRLPLAERHDFVFAGLTDALFAELERALGRAARRESVIFVGDYDFTPVGVHTDPVPIIQAVVSGQKRAHFWNPGTWNREPRDPGEPRRFLSDATTIELSGGDMVYWPAGEYHVFECDRLSVGVSCGFPDEVSEELATP
jgi:hypothetical protein